MDYLIVVLVPDVVSRDSRENCQNFFTESAHFQGQNLFSSAVKRRWIRTKMAENKTGREN